MPDLLRYGTGNVLKAATLTELGQNVPNTVVGALTLIVAAGYGSVGVLQTVFGLADRWDDTSGPKIRETEQQALAPTLGRLTLGPEL